MQKFWCKKCKKFGVKNVKKFRVKNAKILVSDKVGVTKISHILGVHKGSLIFEVELFYG